MPTPEGCHPHTQMDVIREGIVRHYHNNLAQGATRQQAARLVVMDQIVDLNIPPERHTAHAALVASILTTYEAEEFDHLIDGME